MGWTEGASATEPPSPSETPVAASDGVASSSEVEGYVSRPDSVSAMVTARSLGESVVDLSQTDPMTLVLANPDGSWSTDTAPEPVRAPDQSTGEWDEIDTTLVDTGNGFAPANALGGLKLSDGGDTTFASMEAQRAQ